MQSVREVYSLLMPVHDGRVIVPRAAVAEVTGYSRPKDRPEGAPEFVLGFIDWQGQRIPLVSFEAARGQPVPELGRRTRIAVLFGIAERLKPNVFAVVTQGYPYLVRVNENVLQNEPMETEDPLVLARVRMANEKPYIPNLDQLEVLIAQGLGISENEPAPEIADEPVDELDAFDAGGEEELDALVVDEADASIDLDEVTAFGAETDYSGELDELSSALESDETPTDESNEESDDFAVDLSGFELDEDDEGASGDEFDLSDLEIDLDEDEESKKDS